MVDVTVIRDGITIVENVAVRTDIARTNLLAETLRKYPKSIWGSKI